jgi:hypothetical protein
MITNYQNKCEFIFFRSLEKKTNYTWGQQKPKFDSNQGNLLKGIDKKTVRRSGLESIKVHILILRRPQNFHLTFDNKGQK